MAAETMTTRWVVVGTYVPLKVTPHVGHSIAIRLPKTPNKAE
jgi:hypothetical protein